MISTALSVPANAASGCDSTDPNLLTITVIPDSTTPLIEISNTSTDCAFDNYLEIHARPILTYPYNFVSFTVNSIVGTRVLETSTLTYYIRNALGNITIEPGDTLVLLIAARANDANPNYVINFSGGTYSKDITFYAQTNTTRNFTGNIPVAGNNIITAYGPYEFT
ncbi:MAG: hypothetical protein QM571_04505 [Micrococcaceae bacterium]